MATSLLALGRRVVSLLVGATAIGYFLYFTGRTVQRTELATLLSSAGITRILLASVTVLGTVLTTSWAWRRLLIERRVVLPLRQLTAILALTQMAKYLPGNVGHHLARAAIVYREGVSPGDVAASLALEGVLIVAAAVGVGGAGYGVRHEPSLSLLILIAGGIGFLYLSPSRRAALLAYILNFVLLGVGLYLVAGAVGPTRLPNLPTFAGAFALAWVAGFVVPGAPAGLGVREGILVALLTPVLGSAAVLPVVLGYRVATTLSDLAAFSLGMWLQMRPSEGAGATSSAETG